MDIYHVKEDNIHVKEDNNHVKEDNNNIKEDNNQINLVQKITLSKFIIAHNITFLDKKLLNLLYKTKKIWKKNINQMN